MYTWDPTTPSGQPRLSFDFTKALPAAVTVSSATVSAEVHELSEATDATPSARLSGSPSISGAIVSQLFVAGVVEVSYVLTFLATFSDGQKEPAQGLMRVQKYL